MRVAERVAARVAEPVAELVAERVWRESEELKGFYTSVLKKIPEILVIYDI